MPTKNKNDSFASRLVHLGRPEVDRRVSVNYPVHRASTILFPTLAEFDRAYGVRYDDSNYIYGRLGTLSGEGLREVWGALEGAHGVVLTSCGASAIATALWGHLSRGAHLLMADSVYGPVRTFCDDELQRFGVETTFYDPLIGDGIADLIRDETRVIYMESPGSLTLEVQDVAAIVAVARAHKIVTMMDNTWATPYFFRPLAHGVCVSIQAATKYVCGHSDGLLGIIATDHAHYDAVRKCAVNTGQFAAADEIALALRGLRTLAVRLDRHYQTGLRLAEFLRDQPGVRRVIHPALPHDPGHEIWRRDFSGACGLFSIILEPRSRAALSAMVDGLRYFGLGASWGGYESLVMPGNPRAIRTATAWDEDGHLLRVHAGLEDAQDLMDDLAAGLARFNATN